MNNEHKFEWPKNKYMSVFTIYYKDTHSFINPFLQWHKIHTSGLYALDLEA